MRRGQVGAQTSRMSSRSPWAPRRRRVRRDARRGRVAVAPATGLRRSPRRPRGHPGGAPRRPGPRDAPPSAEGSTASRGTPGARQTSRGRPAGRRTPRGGRRQRRSCPGSPASASLIVPEIGHQNSSASLWITQSASNSVAAIRPMRVYHSGAQGPQVAALVPEHVRQPRVGVAGEDLRRPVHGAVVHDDEEIDPHRAVKAQVVFDDVFLVADL